MAGNSFLARTLRELETLSALIIILFGTPTHEACPSDHPALVDAIEAGDEALAADLMLHHLDHVESSVRLESPPAGTGTAGSGVLLTPLRPCDCCCSTPTRRIS